MIQHLRRISVNSSSSRYFVIAEGTDKLQNYKIEITFGSLAENELWLWLFIIYDDCFVCLKKKSWKMMHVLSHVESAHKYHKYYTLIHNKVFKDITSGNNNKSFASFLNDDTLLCGNQKYSIFFHNNRWSSLFTVSLKLKRNCKDSLKINVFLKAEIWVVKIIISQQ